MGRGLFDRIGDAPGTACADHLRAFRALVLAHWATQAWAWWWAPPELEIAIGSLGFALSAVVLTACTGVALVSCGSYGKGAAGRRVNRFSSSIGTVVAACLVAGIAPFTPNHTFLALVCLAVFALLDPETEDEGVLALAALRWLAVIVFFWAGVQKLTYGLYFRGEFLTWMIAHGGPRWAALFSWIVPDAELARLSSYGRYSLEAGPYRANSLLLVLLSNSVWLAEVGLALGMFWQRTRVAAALAAIALTFLIQLAPREFMFALLYAQLLFLFVPGEWNRRLLIPLLALYVYLVAVLMGAPGELLLRRGGTL